MGHPDIIMFKSSLTNKQRKDRKFRGISLPLFWAFVKFYRTIKTIRCQLTVTANAAAWCLTARFQNSCRNVSGLKRTSFAVNYLAHLLPIREASDSSFGIQTTNHTWDIS